MTGKGLEALVLSLQEKITWATAEIAKRDAIIDAQAIKVTTLQELSGVFIAAYQGCHSSVHNVKKLSEIQTPQGFA